MEAGVPFFYRRYFMSRIFDRRIRFRIFFCPHSLVDFSCLSSGFEFFACSASSSAAAVEMTRRRKVDRITLRTRGTLQTLDKAV
jgi:hypothetical protein